MSETDYNTIAPKALKDFEKSPSVWIVDFPSKEAATSGSKALDAYMQDVRGSRCWASRLWLYTVYASGRVPQDDSEASIVTRTSYMAKVALHIQRNKTPWLAVESDRYVSKRFDCEADQFHGQLVSAVLEGFVVVTPAILTALEPIMQSLCRSVASLTGAGETRSISFQRYEYVPQSDMIRSDVRIITFSLDDRMKDIYHAKKQGGNVSYAIQYSVLDASFNQKVWLAIAESVTSSRDSACLEFVKKVTINCDPCATSSQDMAARDFVKNSIVDVEP